MPDILEGAGPPASNLRLAQYVQMIRMFMRDYSELNRLFVGEEHSDRMITWAVLDALNDINTTPPFMNFTLDSFPSPYILMRGAVISLLESVGLLHTRNHLTFSDGGIQVGVSDKTPLIQSWIQIFTNKYEQKKKDMLIALNIEQGWGGGMHSEYMWTNGFYGGW